MSAGTRHCRVTVLTASAGVQDSMGQVAADYATIGDRWVEIEQLEGRELERARAIVADASHRVTMLWDPQVTTRSRLLYRGRVLEVAAVNNTDERRKEMVLVCREAVT